MNYNAFILTLIAGFTTIIGFFTIYIKRKRETIIPLALGFSAGIMIIISLMELLPEAYKYFNINFITKSSIILCSFFIILGFSIAVALNNIIERKNTNDLYRIGILSLITLILHNIPEGIITYLTSTFSLKLGILLTISIAIHNIPEGICIAIPIYYSTNSKLKALFMVIISAISEPIGAILGHTFLENYLSNTIIAILLSLVAGIMLALSITEILKEAFKYSKRKAILASIISIFVPLLLHLLL